MIELTACQIEETHLFTTFHIMDIWPGDSRQKRIQEFEKTHKLLYELMSSYLGEGMTLFQLTYIDIDTIERSIVNHVEYTLASTRFDFDETKAYLATSHRYTNSFNEM